VLRHGAAVAAAVVLAVTGCGAERASHAPPTQQAATTDRGPADTETSASGRLPFDATWQWQLEGEVTTTYDVDVYDIDLFDNTPELIEGLHADGRTVICYFSAGSHEAWRPDAESIDETARGDFLEGYDDERWLDVRDASVRGVMRKRLDLAVERGCDGVEPDNVDGYANDTGFDLTPDDQIDFNRFLSAEAHDRGLSVGLKNDLDQIPELVASFDFAVNEQCFEYDECEALRPFIEAGKPVFNAEYLEELRDDHAALCSDALERGLHTLVLPVDLDDSFRVSCDP
jgi:hypothetical protein